MAVETTCSGCGKKLAVAEEHAGKRARCPACGQIYTIPFPASGPISPPSPIPAPTPEAERNDLEENIASAVGDSSQDDRSADPAEGSYSAAATGSNADSNSASAPGELFWMQAVDGSVYGPVDRATLDRWFYEGRVGEGYRIRRGENGFWSSPDAFRPTASQASAANPYGDASPYRPTSSGGLYTYPKADQSALILVMGILGIFACQIFAVVAWVMGATALKDIEAGRMDPSNKVMVQVGYYLGMVSCILTLLCLGAYFLFAALAIVANA